ncbi:FUSC family protein [Fulvimarina sp. 2208YS6-2-32]|uniref:FUSC family protein n=1 Tax=Fulvimarina uroteuthidis TaxID=3098149 RepID=A0ABU5HXY2_9HYPH|nr:FUSC family protein [Fulvimarina sp. 2208YS6-2-32]MDY8107998.1 FUSC family protein [Fulvimarina sp. 2208YS6-2-32]
MREASILSGHASWEARLTHVLGAAGLDGEQALYAFKVTTAAGLTMFLAFLIDLPYTYWALLTLPLVVTPQSGMTVWRSAARVGGTLVGAVAGLAFVGMFAQNGLVMIACLALWIFGCGYNARSQLGFDGYAYGTAGLTALVVCIDTGANADMAFSFAYWRTTETIIAVIASFVVLLTLFPRSVRDDLVASFDDATTRVFDLVRDAAALNEEQGAKARLGAATSLTGLYTLLRAQKLERNHVGPDFARLRSATVRLNRVFIDSGGLSATVSRAAHHAILIGDLEAKRRRLEGLVADLPKPSDDIAASLARIADLRGFADELERGQAMAKAALGSGEPERIEGLLTYRMRETAAALADYLDAAVIVADPKRAPLPDRAFDSRYADRSAAIQRGFRPAVAFFAVSMFWIFSGSGNGAILALITGALSLLIPTILPRAILATAGIKIFLGFMAGGALAFMLLLLLPHMNGFTGFLALFLPTIFVTFYVCKGPNRAIALGATIMIAIALQPANDQTYDAVRLFNIVVTLSIMPAAFVSAMLIVLPEDKPWLRRHLARAGTSLMRAAADGDVKNEDSFIAKAIDVVADYGGDLDMDDEADAQLVNRVKAVAHAGHEMIAIDRLSRTGHLPEALAGDIATVRAAVVSAVKKRGVADPAREVEALDEARGRAAAALALFEGPSVMRTAMLRYALALALLRTVIVQGRIALPAERSR